VRAPVVQPEQAVGVLVDLSGQGRDLHPALAGEHTERDRHVRRLVGAAAMRRRRQVGAVGLGQDPLNADELAFVYEKNLKVLPTFAVMQGYAAYWLRRPEIGVIWAKVVHGEQGLVLHQPVAPQGTVIGRTRILDVVDKGEGKGALIYSQREISDKTSGRLLATLKQTTFCRGDGGFDFGAQPRLRRRGRADHERQRSATAARAGYRVRPADPDGNGADLPPVRRYQCAACRPGIRQGRRLPAPGLAWAGDLRGRRPRAAQGGMRL